MRFEDADLKSPWMFEAIFTSVPGGRRGYESDEVGSKSKASLWVGLAWWVGLAALKAIWWKV